ncbi:paired amphipathic helix protein Sin3-like 4 [Vicia villosa]|uniref:paired amphipathic helix protein Sin3-like 4 n=1 Tax=Vicia villosa TaxID=3911 RepID=UPI00273C8141|nr:paired amphipathic helix protein Sin3-like 4 [Vicia villosa]
MSSSRTNDTFDDVLAYVKTVRSVFEDKIEKFDEFVRLIRDYEARRIEIEAVKDDQKNGERQGDDNALAVKEEQKDDKHQGDDVALAVKDEEQV